MSKTEITAEHAIPQIVMTRDFDAPRDLVFRAYTDPQLLVQWLGPRDLNTTIDRYDVRDGGKWRYVQTDSEGREHPFYGIFHGAPSPDVILHTFHSQARPAHIFPPPLRSAHRP